MFIFMLKRCNRYILEGSITSNGIIVTFVVGLVTSSELIVTIFFWGGGVVKSSELIVRSLVRTSKEERVTTSYIFRGPVTNDEFPCYNFWARIF